MYSKKLYFQKDHTVRADHSVSYICALIKLFYSKEKKRNKRTNTSKY